MLVSDLACRDMEDRTRSAFDWVTRVFRACLRRPAANPVTIPDGAEPDDLRAISQRLLLDCGRPHVADTPGPSLQTTDGVTTSPSIAETEPLAPIPLPVATAATDHRFRWRKHPMLLEREAPGQFDLDDPGRGARAAATRGLFLARSGRFDDASEAFTVAAHDMSIDLTALPGFWDLPRGGVLAAVDGYESAGRIREAASLSARIRLKYKLRLVPESPASARSQTR